MPTASSRPSPLLQVTVVFACAAISLVAGHAQGVFDGNLIDTDSYARLSRIEAMLETGQLLHHTPRDNGGVPIALHWTHLLDGMILLLSLPFRPFFAPGEALRLGGAAIGPVSTIMVALAAARAVRLVAGSARHALGAAALAALAPGIIAYGAFGRADHHVVLAAIAVITPALAYAAGGNGRGLVPAVLAGALGGVGEWLSPEQLPFVLFAWAIAALRDVEQSRRVGVQAMAVAVGHLGVVLLVWLIDPPSGGRTAVEVDRLSLPYVELAAGMFVVPLVLRRFIPVVGSPWLASIIAGATLAVPLVAWVVHYPDIIKGAGGIFSPEAIERIWRYVAEMQPAKSPADLALLVVFPTLVLAGTLGLLLWRTRSPMALLLASFAVFLLCIGVAHVRFAMYVELAAVVSLGVAIEVVTREGVSRAWRIAAVAAWLALLAGPFVLSAALPGDARKSGQGACEARWLKRDLEPLGGQIVLAPFSLSPEILYFTRSIMVAGPYHRAERMILASLDALDETSFSGGMPKSFAATKARAVIVCPRGDVKPGSLAAALKDGRPPDWLVERPLDPRSGFRLYVVR